MVERSGMQLVVTCPPYRYKYTELCIKLQSEAAVVTGWISERSIVRTLSNNILFTML